MLKLRNVVVLTTLISIASPASADIDDSGLQYSAYLGGAYPTIRPSTLVLQGEVDQLVPYKHSQSEFTWGLGAGYRFLMPGTKNHSLFHDIVLGLDLFQFKTTQRGAVWQFQDPLFNNFTYALSVKSLRIMADSEWTFGPLCSNFFPFAEGGIGVTRNKSSYADMPDGPFGGTGVTLVTRTQNKFAYTLGGGLKYLFRDNLELSLRYLYTNLGHTTTANVANLTLMSPVTTSLYTQDWLIGFTYLA